MTVPRGTNTDGADDRTQALATPPAPAGANAGGDSAPRHAADPSGAPAPDSCAAASPPPAPSSSSPPVAVSAAASPLCATATTVAPGSSATSFTPPVGRER